MASLSNGKLSLSFAPLFDGHRASLDEQEIIREIEAILEEEMEVHLSLSLCSEGQTQSSEEEHGHAYDEDVVSKHARDKSALIVQKVFSVKIRHVFKSNEQVPYHLGMSCNFQDESKPE